MAAPKKNTFWKLRLASGRKRIFRSPKALMDKANEYFQWCISNPWLINEVIKSGPKAGKIVTIPTARPFTIAGFCVHIGVNSRYFNDFEKSLVGKEDGVSKDFSEVISYIKDIMRTQKFEGAAVGVFNANIISRDLGLIDKTDVTTDGESLGTAFSDLVLRLNKKYKEHEQSRA